MFVRQRLLQAWVNRQRVFKPQQRQQPQDRPRRDNQPQLNSACLAVLVCLHQDPEAVRVTESRGGQIRDDEGDLASEGCPEVRADTLGVTGVDLVRQRDYCWPYCGTCCGL